MKPRCWAIAIAGIVASGLTLIERVPPRSVTYGNMHMMKRRILRFAAVHDSLPTSLDTLPRIEGYSNEVLDGWGSPILWRVEGDDVILISYGRDGTPGGAGEDADMTGVFRVKTEHGRWSDEFCGWRLDPFDTKK